MDESMQANESVEKPALPLIISLRELESVEAFDPETREREWTAFYYTSKDDEVYFCEIQESLREATLEGVLSVLTRIEDSEIYPEVPTDVQLIQASDDLDEKSAFVKRPGLTDYRYAKGTEHIPQQALQETLIMNEISRSPHPVFIRYYGCRVRRGRITALMLERHEQTLSQMAERHGLRELDKAAFYESVESAIDHLHSLGLAHNDINPYNIMVKDNKPVLIDFGSCQPFGKRLSSCGTAGWFEEMFYTSEKKHDEYSLRKLREWLGLSPKT